MDPLNISNVRNRIQTDYAIKPQNNANENDRAEKVQSKDTEKKTEEVRSDRKPASEEAKAASEVRDSVYGDVLDISEDGDTVTARPEALKALDDGLVIFKGDEEADSATKTLEAEEEAAEAREEIRRRQEEAAEAAKEAREELRAQADEEKASEETAAGTEALNAYSDKMLDTMYAEGKIDNNEYNAEESRRERIDETRADDNNKTGTAGDTAERLKDDAEKLGELNAKAQDQEIDDQAFETALENNRAEVYQNIFVGQTN